MSDNKYISWTSFCQAMNSIAYWLLQNQKKYKKRDHYQILTLQGNCKDIEKKAKTLGNDKLLNKGNPRKRINVKVDYETHKKLRVVSAIQDRSLDKIVGSIIEYEVGAENNIDTVKLMNEILESVEDKE